MLMPPNWGRPCDTLVSRRLEGEIGSTPTVVPLPEDRLTESHSRFCCSTGSFLQFGRNSGFLLWRSWEPHFSTSSIVFCPCPLVSRRRVWRLPLLSLLLPSGARACCDLAPLVIASTHS